MGSMKLYFATNRKHEGNSRWEPAKYTGEFSSNGRHNLRFGELDLDVDIAKVGRIAEQTVHGQKGDGEKLAKYLSDRAKNTENIAIKALEEDPFERSSFEEFTSTMAFKNIKTRMEQSSDVLVFIHGYNVEWHEAVGSALSLQYMLNRNRKPGKDSKEVMVFLFSWPSDGSAMPFIAYWSDRRTAEGSGPAVGRAILKLHNYLCWLNDTVKAQVLALEKDPSRKPSDTDETLCKRDIHLLCHSMGNYVLENSLPTVLENLGGQGFPRLFEHIFLCASDVDDDVLEPGQPMGQLHSLARNVSVYYNNRDVALAISDKTKGNPDRLGGGGVARPGELHRKVHQIDCTPVIDGTVEHSYYLWATVIEDIRMSVHDTSFNDSARKRTPKSGNSWVIEK